MRVSMLQLLVVIVGLASASSASAGDALEAALDATCRIVNGGSSGTCFFFTRDADVQVAQTAQATVVESTDTEQDKADEADDAEAAEGAKPAPAQKVILVTAAHVFDGKKSAECRLILRTRKDDGSFARREVTIKTRQGEKKLWKKHPDLDVAAMEVELPSDVAITPLKLGQICDESRLADRTVRVGQEVFIPGYPVQLEGNAAGCAVVRRGTIATYPLSPATSAKDILVHSNTFGGDSGAPVVVTSAEEPLVVGIVIGMQRQTDKASMSFGDITSHTPLGLAIVIQAPFITETIDLLGK